MPEPPIVSHCLAFPPDSLDVAEHLNHTYCVGWRDSSNPNEHWTKLCNAAKAQKSVEFRTVLLAATAAAIRCDFKASSIIVLPLIKHCQTQAYRGDLTWHLAENIASAIGGHFERSLLKKKQHRQLQGLDKETRDKTVAGKYMYRPTSQSFDPTQVLFILVDDFVTRGSTMNEAARAIRTQHPNAQVVGFALAKTYRSSYSGLQNNDHFDQNIRRITGYTDECNRGRQI